MSVKVSAPIPGSTRAREQELRDKLMGKRYANAEGQRVEPEVRVFTGGERNAMVEAFGALWLAVREWWASWFSLTPRARKVLRRVLVVAWVVWALIAPSAAGYFVGAWLLPAWLIVRVWKLQGAIRRKHAERKARPQRERTRKQREVRITWG